MTGKPLAPWHNAVVDRYLSGVDRTLLRRNLALTPQQRLEQLESLAGFADELRRAGKAARGRPGA